MHMFSFLFFLLVKQSFSHAIETDLNVSIVCLLLRVVCTREPAPYPNTHTHRDCLEVTGTKRRWLPEAVNEGQGEILPHHGCCVCTRPQTTFPSQAHSDLIEVPPLLFVSLPQRAPTNAIEPLQHCFSLDCQ